MKIQWKKDSNGVVYTHLGNNLHIVIKPVTLWIANKRRNTGGKDVRFWEPSVVAGGYAPASETEVRRWTGGGNGHGQYETLTAAKRGGIEDAKAVGIACLRSLGIEVPS